MAPKKKLTKKEKARLEAEQAEILRNEQEREKQKRFEEALQQKQIELERAKVRQRREMVENKTRKNQLKSSMNFFDKVNSIINGVKAQAKEQRVWEKYMRCNGLPNAQNPSDLRKYIHQWQTEIKRQDYNSRNWLLQANERTLLTQDSTLPDLSQKNLRKQQGSLGDVFASRVQEVLGILNEIDEALMDTNTAQHIKIDLERLKMEIRLFLKGYLDSFTSKILSHIERDMCIHRPGVWKHIYEASVFKTHVWCFAKDSKLDESSNQKIRVPEQGEHNDINFDVFKMQIALPRSLRLQNSAVRGLWLSFDHLSDYCNSFQPAGNQEHTFGNILKQTKFEWKKRKDILQEMIDKCANEDPLQFATKSEEENGEATVESKIANFDVDKLYTEYEDELTKARREEIGPDSFGLSEYDVNLRKYRIIGGLYCIDYLEIPPQDKRLNSRSYIRSVNSELILSHKEFFELYKPPPPVLPGVRRLPEEIEAEMRMVEAALDKLALISLSLPDSVIWFEPPVVCRWETAQEALESETLLGINAVKSVEETLLAESTHGSVTSDNTPENVSPRPEKKTFLKESQTLSLRIVKDFDMLNMPPNIDIRGIMKDIILPRLPLGFNVKMTEEENLRLSRKKSTVYNDLQDDDTIENQSFIDLFLKAPDMLQTSKQLKCDKEKYMYLRRPRDPCNLLKEELTVMKPTSFSIEHFINFDDAEELCSIEKINENFKILPGDELLIKENQEGSYIFSNFLKDLEKLRKSEEPDGINELPNNLQEQVKQSKNALTRKNQTDKQKVIQKRDYILESSSDEEDTLQDSEKILTEKKLYSVISSQEDNVLFKGKQIGGKWSTRDIHDTKFNEDKLAIQFRTGRFGMFGLALNRYSNMPYQTWELRPDLKNPGTVFFNFTASIINLDMVITSDGYCVNNFQGGTTNAINNLIGKTVSLAQLKSTLISSAVDIFPEEDTFCYTEGSCQKNYVMEMHLYACMSTLVLSQNFSWSRWNLLAGSRTAVLLMRELIEGKKIPFNSTVLVTPLNTAIVDCTEVSASFNPKAAFGMKYYADLYQLAQSHLQAVSLEKQREMDPILSDNIMNILMALRPLSFC